MDLEAPSEAAALLESYRRRNESFNRRLLCPIGVGAGFGAEWVGLLKNVIGCLQHSVRFTFESRVPARGWAVERGWEDYFLPFCTSSAKPHFSLSNNPRAFIYNRRGLSTLAKSIQRLSFGAVIPAFDAPRPVARPIPLPELETLDWWPATQRLAMMLWHFRPDVSAEIDRQIATLSPPLTFAAVHIRRGDKISESPYQNIEDYFSCIRQTIPAGISYIFVASDDDRVTEELASELGSEFRVFRQVRDRHGYAQDSFNASDRETRRKETIEFLSAVEMMRRARICFAASPSNVYYMLRYLRGNTELIDVRCHAPLIKGG